MYEPMWVIMFLGMFSSFSFKLTLSLEKVTLFNQTCRIPSIRPHTQDHLNECLLKVNMKTSAQKLSGSTIYTGIRALSKTEQRINTKNWSKNQFRKILNACQASNIHGDSHPFCWRSSRLWSRRELSGLETPRRHSSILHCWKGMRYSCPGFCSFCLVFLHEAHCER